MTDQLKNLVEKIYLPYQVTQLNKNEISLLEKKFDELSDKELIEVIRIAKEIFDSEMPGDVKEEEGRWYYSLIYGVAEFLQENYYQQAEQATCG